MSEQNSEVVSVGQVDPSKKNSALNLEGEVEKCGPICWFNGQQYSQGARVCSGGNLLQCYISNNNGWWSRVGSC